ncbi:MAG: DUF5666 domain-containing protein [Patescibacteria group bacterium]
MKRNQLIGAIVAVVVVGGGAFYGGTIYAKGQAPMRGGQFFTSGTGGQFAGRVDARMGSGFTAGQILSVSNGSITIQNPMSSSTEIVLIGAATQISKMAAGSISDLQPGTSVVVTGQTNSDGSITAQSIQLRPTVDRSTTNPSR